MNIHASPQTGSHEGLATTGVLVVDDEGLVCWSLQTSLLRAGFRVATAQSLEEAHELIRNHPFDVCITDLKLGTGNGFDVARACKQFHPSSIVVMISAFLDSPEFHEKGKLQEVDFLVEKPLDLNEMVSLVRRLTGKGEHHTAAGTVSSGEEPPASG